MTFALLIILLISSLWTILVLRSAVVSLHQAGKTEEEIQQVKTGYSAIQRLFLLNVKDSSAGMKKYNLYRKNIEKFLFGYIIAMFVMWILLVLAVIFENMVTFVSVIIIAKTVLIDIVVVAFYLKSNTVIDKKNKTIHWKWANK